MYIDNYLLPRARLYAGGRMRPEDLAASPVLARFSDRRWECTLPSLPAAGTLCLPRVPSGQCIFLISCCLIPSSKKFCMFENVASFG